jgi:flagellar biosynthetic protein FlhB
MAEGEKPDAEDRTEDPTQRRLDRARDDGNVPLSREALGFAGLLTATLVGMLVLPPLTDRWLRLLAALLQAPDPVTGARAAELLVRETALGLLPVLGAIMAAAVLATFGQVGLLLRLQALAPDLNRLNPMTALGRLFGSQGVLEMVKSLLKLGILGVALWLSVDVETLRAALQQPAGAMLGTLGREALHLLVVALVAYGLLAGFDIVLVRWQHQRQLRMSRHDLREEHREAEGDPLIKAKLRRLREARARQRMLAAVPKAAVVITNPTHYAVALAYEQGQTSAPKLVAKGVDEMAARIREAAAAHGVPIVANPPLARALYRLEPDTEIPAEHWQAVAEIIAFVWGLRRG